MYQEDVDHYLSLLSKAYQQLRALESELDEE